LSGIQFLSAIRLSLFGFRYSALPSDSRYEVVGRYSIVAAIYCHFGYTAASSLSNLVNKNFRHLVPKNLGASHKSLRRVFVDSLSAVPVQ
jgi:hypothetical protein